MSLSCFHSLTAPGEGWHELQNKEWVTIPTAGSCHVRKSGQGVGTQSDLGMRGMVTLVQRLQKSMLLHMLHLFHETWAAGTVIDKRSLTKRTVTLRPEFDELQLVGDLWAEVMVYESMRHGLSASQPEAAYSRHGEVSTT